MLTINKVVLFKTGIGYFERRGKIDPKKFLNLSFKSNVMNDILATLSIGTVNSLVTGISYEGAEIDLARALEDALIKIPSENSYLTLLKQLIGSSITLFIGGEEIEGLVLGIQELKKGYAKTIINEPYLVMSLKNGAIKNIKISELTGPNAKLSISDEKMKKELQFFMEKMYTSKKKDMKSVTIFFEGESEDEVTIMYLHEMPSWKVSYRLAFIDEDNFLQGWALIDNTLDEDWENIELSLVAGLPISFIYDLYTPNWMQRPTVARRDRYDLKVGEFEEELTSYPEMKEMAKSEVAAGSGDRPAAPRPAPMMAPGSAYGGKAKRSMKVAVMEKDVDSFEDKQIAVNRLESTKVEAKGEEAGDFFEYKIMVPVTVKRNQSSLVPILQSKISGKRMSVYNQSVKEDNPMLCVELTNDTGLTLEEGPITVYETSTFVGEAMLPFIRQSEKRRIPYSVDLGITVSNKWEEKVIDIHEIKLEKEYLSSFQYRLKQCEYIVKNKSEDDREVIVEHPKEYAYELYDTEKPFEESANFYRYKVTVSPKTQVKLLIKTRRVDKSSWYIPNVSKPTIDLWFSQKLINEKERDFLLAIWKLSSEKSDTDRKISELQTQKSNIINDQTRLRENIRSLGVTTSEERLRDKYIVKLDAQEKELEANDKNTKELTKKSQELAIKINEEIRKRPVEE